MNGVSKHMNIEQRSSTIEICEPLEKKCKYICLFLEKKMLLTLQIGCAEKENQVS